MENFNDFGSSQPASTLASKPGESAPPEKASQTNQADGINLIAAALAKAQAEFVQPEKNKTVEVKNNSGTTLYTFDYADYNAIVEAVRGPLSKNGIAFTHLLEQNGIKWELVTMLIHDSGQVLECVWPIPNTSDPKAIGGAMTYGKRYCLSAITGCVADDDLDAEPQNVANFQERKPANPPKPGGAEKPKPPANPTKIQTKTPAAPPVPVTEAQLARLFAIADEKKWAKEQVKEYLTFRFKHDSTKKLTRDEYDEFVNTIVERDFNHAMAGAAKLGLAKG